MSDIKEIKVILEKQNEMIKDIHFAVYGNPQANLKGMAGKVDDHDKYISNDKKFKWTVAGLMGGGLGSMWAYIKSHFGF